MNSVGTTGQMYERKMNLDLSFQMTHTIIKLRCTTDLHVEVTTLKILEEKKLQNILRAFGWKMIF